MSFNFGGGSNPPAFGAAPAGGSITFGTPIPQTGGLFGSAPVSSAGPSFFGTPASSAPSFGTPSNTGLSFGTPASQGLSFGAPANTSMGFGAPSNTGLSFGAAANPGLSFGTPASTGLSFGTPSSTGLSFGAPVGSNTTAPSFNFGAPAQPLAPSLGFGMSSAAPTLNFGSPRPTGSLSFGTGGLGTGGGGLNFGTSNVPTLNFGTSAPNLLGTYTATTAPGTGYNFGFGGNVASMPSTSLGFASKPMTTSTSIAPSIGLGGIVSSTPAKTGTVASADRTEISPKDQPLPNEFVQTVEAFKVFIKQQEAYCNDISKFSIKDFKHVKEEIDLVNNKLNTAEKQLQCNRLTAEKLKYDSAKSLQQVEMAQRTHDTPPGLQYDNNAPLLFFIELVDTFEKEMQHIKLQIESADKYVRNFGSVSPLTSYDLSLGLRRLHDTFVALAGRLQSVHSQVEYHKEQYLNYRKYMLHDDDHVSNVFERRNAEADALQVALKSIDMYNTINKQKDPFGNTIVPAYSTPPKVSSGPTPFGTTLDQSNAVQAQHQQQMQLQQQQQAVAGLTLPTGACAPAPSGPPPPYPGTLSFGSPAPTMLGAQSTGSLFGSPSTLNPLSSFSPHGSSTFPLQKPPVGNKRGKP